MIDAFLSWWSNPVTAVLLAGVAWSGLALSNGGLVALVRMGGIPLGGLLSQRPNLLPGFSRRGDALAAIVLFLSLGEGFWLLAFFAAALRGGLLVGGGLLAGVTSGALGWALAVLLPLVLVKGPRAEALVRMTLSTLRPWTPVLAALAPEREPHEEIPEEEEDDEFDEHEVKAFIGAGEEAGILEREEAELIASIVELSDTVTREIMTPRTDVVALPMSGDFEAVQRRFAESMFTRIPVFRDTVDRIEGMIHVKDVLKSAAAVQRPTAGEMLRSVLVVPETKPVSALLREFQSSHQQIAVVVDEYGGTSGIVTLEDVLEEIVGEIQDEHQREVPEVEREEDGAYLLAGGAHVEVLEELFGVEVGEEGFDSVAGLVMERLGHVPRIGERAVWQGLELEVVEAERRRLRRVRARRLEASP